MANPLDQLIGSLSAEKRSVLAELLRPAPEPIAIIGMGCRFPGGITTPGEFWNLLKHGSDAIIEAPPERWNSSEYYDPDPDAPGKMYTRWGGFLRDIGAFDAKFFGISPKETLRMDPQHRMLLEVAWEALEHAGQSPSKVARAHTGVFIGIAPNDYALRHSQHRDPDDLDDPYLTSGSSSSMATGRLSYLFDLQGPNMAIDTACSSSLVAAHLACQSLRNKECDLALVGGVNAIVLPEAMVKLCKMRMLAPDGRCKTFDATADGFAVGEGCGILVLKRMSDAVKANDTIMAVIRGSAVNEDGRSSSPTAPNGLAQQAVIRKALQSAGILPHQVGYVEAHGSGTAIGDPIELEALGAVLGKERLPGQPLLIGTVKTNIGHLFAGAGIAGLIKTVLSMQHQMIPANLNLQRLTPGIAWDDYPFVIPRTLTPWHPYGGPRVAGVSSFGWAGTNAHIVLEEAPVPMAHGGELTRPWQLLVLSAKTSTALDRATANLAVYLQQSSNLNLADVAHTLQVGRYTFEQRRYVVCNDRNGAATALGASDYRQACHVVADHENRPVTFLLGGVGEHYPGMAQALYQYEPTFRDAVDECCRLLLPLLGQDLRTLLWPSASAPTPASSPGLLLRRNGHTPELGPLQQTALAQPAVFVVEYAIAQLLHSWGICTTALLGYSLGEYVAACLAGVLSLPDALRLVATRAQLIQTLPPGAMLAVALDEANVTPYLSAEVALAAVNGPTTCVLAGTPAAIAAVAQQLTAQEIACRAVATTHAFHSPLLQPIADQLTAVARTLTFHPPQLPYLSNVTGTWITDQQATDPAYWAQHLCQTVRFGDGIAELLTRGEQALVEVGVGQALGSFVKQHPACPRAQFGLVLPTLPSASDAQDALACLLTTLGKLWLAGIPIDWHGFSQHEQRRRVPLPTYPFERQRFWLDTVETLSSTVEHPSSGKKPDISDWFYRPVWRPTPLSASASGAAAAGPWLVFTTATTLSDQLLQRIEQVSGAVIQVRLGTQFATLGTNRYSVRPDAREDYEALFDELAAQRRLPRSITHLWSIDAEPSIAARDRAIFDIWQKVGFYSLLALVQALSHHCQDTQVHIDVVSTSMQPVNGTELLISEKATLLGPCKVIPQEYQGFTCRSIDLDPLLLEGAQQQELLDQLTLELLARSNDVAVAYRGDQRWTQSFKPERLTTAPPIPARLRASGVYLITGGLGKVGLTLAEYLARAVQAKLVLVGRSGLPARELWSEWLTTHNDDDQVSHKIRRVQGLEKLGSEVLVVQGDVASVADMQSVLKQTRLQFGGLHGVIHGAGILGPDSFHAIQGLERADCDVHFQPKIYGLYALEHVLADQPLDFCVMLSSISAILGGLGFVAYTAANAFMDSFAHRHNQLKAGCWTSVNWDVWQGSGDKDLPNPTGSTLTKYGMLPTEGQEAFARILNSTAAQIINSTGELGARIRDWVLLEASHESLTDELANRSSNPPHSGLDSRTIPPDNDYEQRITAIWQQVLGLSEIGIHDNFFDIGGNSLIGLQVIAKLNRAFKVQIPAVVLFEAPTISDLAQYLRPKGPQVPDQQLTRLVERRERVRQGSTAHDGIAIIGLVGRFPGAANVEQFWQNLQDGVETLTTFTDAELLAAGIAPELVHDPAYVKARPILEEVAAFDAAFFGYTPREAELMDPQQRLFHECAWEALELAGYDSLRYPGQIGVFAGTSLSTYMMQLASDASFGGLETEVYVNNDKDSLTTNVSYKLNLKGPSFAVQTFCSTSLVATHLACRSLRHGECDIALAGGVSVRVPMISGHLYREGDQVSRDGHCRTFDAQAAGATFGDGVGVVVLKRLAEALADGDQIYAVIKGSAINNDGGLKVGYMAPSVLGQTEAVVAALEDAGVSAESISYVEAHGTATPIGDPIEVAALTRAFRQTTARTQFCFLSSVKPNVGHLDRAAGVTGLIKTVMALQHGLLPATLHFQQPNPKIDFAASPFVVTTALTPWPRNGSPRRAGVNSLGVGGTNAHVILEEAPEQPPSGPSRPVQLLLLSAKTATALETATANLQHFLATHSEVPLADVAYTLQVGRRRFAHRRMLLCQDKADALQRLASGDPTQVLTQAQADTSRPVAFLLGGVGEHYPGMAQELYRHEPVFRDAVDECCQLLLPLLGQDLRTLLWPSASAPALATRPGLLLSRNGHTPELGPLQQTALAQPAVFVVEYALAQLLQTWGLRPTALLGYSLGEYVAACLAGVLSLPDALRLVATRAQLIQMLPPGAMLAVALSEAEITPYLCAEVALAAVNGPTSCVLAGTPTAIATVAEQFTAEEIACRAVATTHAFHSPLLQPIADQLTAVARTLTFHPPQLPYLSNVTGTWITPAQATDPSYWAQHLCQTVRFGDSIADLLQRGEQVLVEVGPGQALGAFVKQHPACPRAQFGLILPTLPSASDAQDALACLLTTLGKLWLADLPIEWTSFYQHEQRRRVPLPTYPFERQRFWLEPHRPQLATATTAGKKADRAAWFYQPTWQPAPRPTAPTDSPADGPWLVFGTASSLSEQLIQRLETSGSTVIQVEVGGQFAHLGAHRFSLRPAVRSDYETLLHTVAARQQVPQAVVHLWSLASDCGPDHVRRAQELGCLSLLALAQALSGYTLDTPVALTVVTAAAQPVLPDEPLAAEQAPLLGLCTVVTQENPALRCRSIDLLPPAPGSQEEHALLDLLSAELHAPAAARPIAYRAGQRLVQQFEPVRLERVAGIPTRLRQQGVYLITGGLGGIGLTVADYLARTVQAKLVLTGRTTLPPRSEWAAWLDQAAPDDPRRPKVQHLLALEALGAEVLVLSADVANVDQMQAVLAQTLARFGALHGVVYAAGHLDPSGFQPIQELTPAHCDAHFQAKVHGLYVLDAVLQALPLDFCLLCSSIASVLGGIRYGAYSAANAFIDAFTHRHNRSHPVPWTSVNWDTWELRPDAAGATVAQYQMTPSEAIDAFGRILELRPTQLVNSTGDLDTRIRQWVLLEALQASDEPTSPQVTGHARPILATTYVAPTGEQEQRIAAVWQQVLGLAAVGIHDNFFDLGGNSLIGLQLIARLKQELHTPIPAVALFEAPTVHALTAYLFPAPAPQLAPAAQTVVERRERVRQGSTTHDGIAIIGLVGRFPGAANVEQFWQNLQDGVETLTTFTDAELLAAGVAPELVHDPAYVKARPILDDVAHFDAAFFGYTPREAELMDPQQRLFHECAWEALELAGYDSLHYPGQIGVFAGGGLSTYMLDILSDPGFGGLDSSLYFLNDKDSLTTNVSYKLNLKGPSFAVQTFCSTSLVATHLACRSLRHGECDIALAGGVSVRVPGRSGYLYQEGDQASPDGHCRTFDAQAAGTTFGDGVGVVVLKRLAEALADGDQIYAVIKGSAINNDGGLKVGYMAPSVLGQTEAVVAALEDAGVSAESISYVEAHGTATPIGDPIEVAALTKAFRQTTDRTQFCYLSSVKPNVGHLDRAAGVTGLIKTVMALQHGLLPATLHFQQPNPEIDFASSPFVVTTALTPWPRNGSPRRAGVNSLGVGGTNAHVILEEAPEQPPSGPSRPVQLLLLSAKTATALETATANLQHFLATQAEVPLADVAYTLQVGRRRFAHRCMLICHDKADALQRLASGDDARLLMQEQADTSRGVAFLLGGVGEHYPGMAEALYQHEPLFRDAVDECCRLLLPLLGQDLRTLLWPSASAPALASNSRLLLKRNGHTPELGPLQQTALAQPAVFVVEYALAQLLQSWGIRPSALLGYSLGEYVAACLAGVLSLPDALRLVATRAQLIQTLPPGAMLAVALDEAAVAPYLSAEVALAAVNGPTTCVLAGTPTAIAAVAAQLTAQEIACRAVATTHAFHSPLLQPIADQLTAVARTLTFHPPQLPYLSNVTGTWITDQQATDPTYWAQHLCQTVRFGDGIASLLQRGEQVLVEVGPGQALGAFVKQHPACPRAQFGLVLPTLPSASDAQDALACLLTTLGKLWLADIPIEWTSFYQHEQRRRVPLPTYPFERQRFWLEPHRPQLATATTAGKKADRAAWFYQPTWQPAPRPTAPTDSPADGPWLVFGTASSLSEQLIQRLETSGSTVIQVEVGGQFAHLGAHRFSLRPAVRSDYEMLLRALAARQQVPQGVVHLWSLASDCGPDYFQRAQELGCLSLLALAQALSGYTLDTPVALTVVTAAAQPVLPDEPLAAEQAPLLGLCTVVTQENPALFCRSVDLLPPAPGSREEHALLDLLTSEVLALPEARPIAYRDGQRLVQQFEPVRLERVAGVPARLRQQGVYLITGGLGGIGLTVADYLARTVQAKLVLTGRTTLPPRSEWAAWLDQAAPDDPRRPKVQHLLALEALGAEVLVLSADVANVDQMQAVLAQTLARFGALHGVVYAAGHLDPSGFQPIQELTPAHCDAHFQAKVHGLYVLDAVLQALPLDFCLLCSSIASVLGGIRYGAYSAANVFIDAFTHRHNRSHPVPWTSVNWDTWELRPDAAGATVAQYQMTPSEAIDAFGRILELRPTQLVNSTGDLDTRIRQWVLLEALQASDEPTSPQVTGHARPILATTYVAPTGEQEQRIAAVWQQVLGLAAVGIHDNFFDLGGNSLIGLQLIARLKQELHTPIPAVALFEAPTVHALTAYLFPAPAPQLAPAAQTVVERRERVRQGSTTHDGIAIIGLVGRFPGAANVEQFWQNLQDGVETLTTFTDAELLAAGVAPELVHDPAYVKARPILDDVAHFDAAFFGYTPREAELMDPQQRLFHECAWEALELAGYDSLHYPGQIGVFAGGGLSTYMMQLASTPSLGELDASLLYFLNDKDSLTTNVSYKLNLKGPSFAVQTFCSTSLVATHLACRSLRHGECDIALAGGVSVRVPGRSGYLYQEGDQASPDGHCRTFDAQAAGTTFGDGVGVVVLKRLEDALADGDQIYAVIKGSAINNDGGLKVGYMAPSVLGQTEAVVAALEDAGVSAESISYVEAHGTATPIGDPIEVAALTRAFRQTTTRTQFCYLSSVKPNVGHLDRAAGVTGLIKTVMALQHGLLPATLHFQQPNPEIDFAESPFVVTTALTPWPRNGSPRRAGVNSLGVGGTNAHVILEEAPLLQPSGPSRPVQVLLLSAKTATALESATRNLQHFLTTHAEVPLADVAYTLQVGRRRFPHRRMLVCHDAADACQRLASGDPTQVLTQAQADTNRPVAFLLGGVGEHYPGMAQDLYQHEPVFRDAVDECCRLLLPLLGQDPRPLLWPTAHPPLPSSSSRLSRNGHTPELGPLQQTALAQPAVFVVEYALAQLLQSWGIRPSALLGYSLGEYVAACLAGVLSLPDALRLVATRAQLIQTLPPGAMLAVALDEAAVAPYLSAEVALAAVNGPTTCALAGTPTAIAEVAHQLTAQEIACRAVATTHAFHSPLLQPIADQLTAVARTLTFHPPQLPYLSNVTGTWITDQQATDPTYWAQHLCQTVRFGDGIAELLTRGEQVLVEVGAGQALGAFVKQHPACPRAQFGLILPTLPSASDAQDALACLLTTLGKLWLADIPIDWTGFYQHEQRRRIPLPTYPFERQRFWLEPQLQRERTSSKMEVAARPNVTDWFSVSSWKRSSIVGPRHTLEGGRCWLLFIDECGVGAWLATWLNDHQQRVITVMPGPAFAKRGPGAYAIHPSTRTDYEALLNDMQLQGLSPHEVVHLWMVTPIKMDDTPEAEPVRTLEQGFYSLLALTQALGDQDLEACRISMVSSSMQDVTGTEQLDPVKATLIGPCKVIPQEYPNLTSRSIDIALSLTGTIDTRVIDHLVSELTNPGDDEMVALRGPHRWVQTFEPMPLPAPPTDTMPHLRSQGVYLITGGLGGIGLALADYLFSTVQAKLVLLNRTPLPPRMTWPTLLAAPDTADILRRRIEQVSALEARGAKILLIQADVADSLQVHAAVQQATMHFGTLNGVFHTAGVPGIGLMQFKTAETAAAVLAPKVQGTLALAAAVRHLSLDCLMLFSSVTSATGGGPGQVDYCAANAFLDAFARRYPTEYGLTVAVSWGEWLWDAWQDGLQGFPEEVRRQFIANRLEYGISFADGMEALRRILSSTLSHVFVTRQDLCYMIEQSRTSYSAAIDQQHQEQRRSQVLYPRPVLGTLYIAPRNELERQIASAWEDVLGIAQIGIDDNFFEVGGNSLLGLTLVSRIRKMLKLEKLPPYVLYTASSISALAAHIGQSQHDDVDDLTPASHSSQRKAQLDYLQRRAQKRTS